MMNKPGDPEPLPSKSIQLNRISPSKQSSEKTSSNTKPFREGPAKDLHNVIERKRKARISYWISKLIEELPNKDPRRESINAVLERAYEYIKQLKQNHQKIMDQKLPAVSTSEMKKLQENNRHMQSLLTRYSALLKMAGISLDAVPSDIEINSCKNHKIPQHQRCLLLASSRPILPKPYHESSVDTTRVLEDDQSGVSSTSAKDSVNDARVRASKEPDSQKSPRGSNDASGLTLPINSPSPGSHVESKSVSSSGALIDRSVSISRPAAQVVTSKESRVAKILPHIKTTDGLITFPQVIAPNTPQIVIFRSNDNTNSSTYNPHVASSTPLIGSNSNLALTGSSNLILGPQLLSLSASPTVVLPSGQIIMTQTAVSTSPASSSTSPLIVSSNFVNQCLTGALNSASSPMSASHTSASHTSVNHCGNQESDQSSISISQQATSLYSVDCEANGSFDDDVRVIDDENHTPMTNDTANSPASSSKTNNHKEARDQGTSASRCCINRSSENSQPQSSVKPASQSQAKSSSSIIKTRHVKVSGAGNTRKRKLLLSKSKFSHKKRRENLIAQRQVSQAKLLIEQALKSIQLHFRSSSKVNCERKKQKTSSNTSITNPILSSPAEATDILMLENLSASNSPLSPSSVNSTSNSSLPNFLCLSPTADQLSDFLQPKCASPVPPNDTVSTVTEVTSNINTCAKRSHLDNSRNNNSNAPITSASSASASISSISNFLNGTNHQDKQQQQQTRKQSRQTRRSGVQLDSQAFEGSDQQQSQQQVQEQLTQSQSQQQTRRSSYMAESLIRQQPVASARSQMANLAPHDVTFSSSVNAHGASSRSTNSANNSATSHTQQSDQESSQLSNLYGDSNDHQSRVYSSPNATSNRSISYSAERLINASQNSRRDESTSSIFPRHSFSGSNLFFDPPANLLPANDLFTFTQNDSRTPGLSLAPLTNDSTAANTFESTFNPACFASAGRNYLSPVPGVTHTPTLISTPISSAAASSSSSSASTASFVSFSAPSSTQSGVFSLAPLTTSHHLSPTHHSTCHNNHIKSSQRPCNSNGLMNNSLTSINPFAIASDFNGAANPSFISVDSSTPNHYPYIRNSVSSSASSSTMRSSDTSSAHVLPLSTGTMSSLSQATTSSSSSSSLAGSCVSAPMSAPSLPPPPNPYFISGGSNSTSSVNTTCVASSPFAPLSIASSTTASYDSPRMPPPLFSNSLAEQWAVSLHSAPVSRRLGDHRNSLATSHTGGSDHHSKSSKSHESHTSTAPAAAAAVAAITSAPSSATVTATNSSNASKASSVVKKNITPSTSHKSNHNIIHVNHNSSANQSGRNGLQLNSHLLNCNSHPIPSNHGNRRITSANPLCHSVNSNPLYSFTSNGTQIHSNQRLQQHLSSAGNCSSEGHSNGTNSNSSSGSNGTSSSNNTSNNNDSTSVHSSSASSSIASHARSDRSDGNFNYSNNTTSNSNSGSSSNNNNGSSSNATSGNNSRVRGVVSSRAPPNASSSSSSATISSSNRTSGVTGSSSSSSSSSLPATSVSSASNSLTPVTTVISSSSSSVTLFAAVAAAAAAPLITDSTSLSSSSSSSIPFTLTALPHPSTNSTGFRFTNIFPDLLRPTSASASSNSTTDVNHFSHTSHLTSQSSTSHLHNQSQGNLSNSPVNCFHHVTNQQQQSVAPANESTLSQSHHIQSVLTLDENNTPAADPSAMAPQFTPDCYHHRQPINQTPFPSNGNIYPF